MSCNRSPPNSPRAPKIQQQSWDDCGTPPIDLYDPQENSQSLRNQPKSPNSPRKPNKPINVGYYEPRSPSISTRMNNQRSPKYDNSPRSPKITTTYANDDTTATQKSFYQSPRRSPKSPRKFVFDAISPSYEQKGRKFEYYEPTSPDDDGDLDISYHSPQQHPLQQLQVDQQFQNKHSISTSLKSRPYDLKTLSNAKLPNRTSKEFSGVEINEINEVHQYNEHLNINDFPGGIQSLYIKRDSCVTESTQISGDSCETNATILTTTTTFISSTIESSHSEAVGKSGNSAITGNAAHSIPGNNETNSILNCVPGKNNSNGSPALTDKYTGRGRRHAINITSNPGYQVLHSSHSTLDRTCSDSIVSLRCRKSTSDLTDVNDGNTHAPPKKPRRRGSSKGGLAYLASRRSSRESIKSACSNTSIFSNEDIGPLAFQSSTRGRQRRTSNFLELPVPDHVRPRVCSLPDRPYNPRFSDDLYRLRHFSISKGTVVNCGDSIISRRSRSNTSVNSTTSRASERSPFDGSCCGGGYANVDSMPASPTPTDSDEPPPPPRYRVVMLGEASVGKTALVSQFMTSEYMHTYDASLDDEFGEKTVSVLLDDEESELVFIDHPSVEMSVENSLSTYEPHSCVIVYSIVDRNSFRVAEEIINYLWRENVTKEKAVILVGNKADLARSRMITTQEGKTLAASRDAKFIETSSGIQHNVDELLVGVLKQMRLKEKRDKKAALVSSKMKNSKTHMSLHLAKEILQKICLSDITKSKSCENLHVL